MTSQHFSNTADGWTEEWGDWGENSIPTTSNNNNIVNGSNNNPNTQPFNNPQVRKIHFMFE